MTLKDARFLIAHKCIIIAYLTHSDFHPSQHWQRRDGKPRGPPYQMMAPRTNPTPPVLLLVGGPSQLQALFARVGLSCLRTARVASRQRVGPPGNGDACKTGRAIAHPTASVVGGTVVGGDVGSRPLHNSLNSSEMNI